MPANPIPSKTPRFSSAINALTIGYVVALALIGAIAGTAHVVTGMVIDAQASNAGVVNSSGLQRMLSQRIALLANHWSRSGNTADRERLEEAILAFEQSHRALVSGSVDGATVTLPESARTIYFDQPYQLDRRVERYIALARTVLDNRLESGDAALQLSKTASARPDHDSELLGGLNQVVSAFQAEHEQQIHDMKVIQNVAFIVLVIALALEAVLIFRPLVRRVNTLAESLGDAAVTDPLTNVNNRRGFMLRGETLAAQRQNGALLILDIDHFKRINDEYGHAAGDACIKHMANLAVAIFRDGDVFARIGGEEFAAVLQGTSEADAIMVAERLRRAVEKTPCNTEQIKCKIDAIAFTVSIGVRPFTQPTPLTDLMQDGDVAMYRAKHEGRNQVRSSTALDVAWSPVGGPLRQDLAPALTQSS